MSAHVPTREAAPGPWAAWSPCTAACAGADGPPVPWPRAVRRAGAFAGVLAGALADGTRLGRPDLLRRRARQVLDALGVRLRTRSTALSAGGRTGTLLVANHISWLDVLAVLAVEPVAVLAKREVGTWPVVGRLVRAAGTLFIDRERLRELPASVAELTAHLRAGRSVLVFPQGVTWCGGAGGAFRPAAFQAALDAAAPVRPLTLGYSRASVPSTAAAFVGEDTFGASLARVLRTDGLTVSLRAHPPLLPEPGTDDRRALAARAQAAVAATEDGARRADGARTGPGGRTGPAARAGRADPTVLGTGTRAVHGARATRTGPDV
ncbi:lysophospholipid acyltransferase family protein [Streptomyces cacaoi]|uniref:lysophospholipid acyltransferase family protein n=1 Tax=Streptomyces cacaoi TaxID=1898 RepID=UPI00331D7661